MVAKSHDRASLSITVGMSYTVLQPLIHPRHLPISSLSFDHDSDVLWSGSSTGSITAHYPTPVRGVTYPASRESHQVTKVDASEKDVKAICESGIGAWSKGGMNRWYLA